MTVFSYFLSNYIALKFIQKTILHSTIFCKAYSCTLMAHFIIEKYHN